MDNNTYPYWKIIAWRFIRVAVAGGVSAVVTVTIVLRPDLSNIKEYGFALLAAFIAGFIGAGGKMLRDWLSKGDNTAAGDKLPI